MCDKEFYIYRGWDVVCLAYGGAWHAKAKEVGALEETLA